MTVEWNKVEYDEDGYPTTPRRRLLVCAPSLNSLGRDTPAALAWFDEKYRVWVSGEVYPGRLWFDPEMYAPVDFPK
jgi:hypothetical protein